MSAQEKKEFVDAFLTLKKKTKKVNGVDVSLYDEFIAMHASIGVVFDAQSRQRMIAYGHSWSKEISLSFLPWHRQFILELEKRLKAINPNVFIPYWDPTSEESTKAVFSPDFAGSYFQGSFQKGPQPVSDGPFAGKDKWLCLDGRALHRNFGSLEELKNAMVRFQPNLIVSRNNNDYMNMTLFLETRPHNFCHGWVGGHLGSIETAVNDLVFWLIHCNTDRLWSKWQDYQPSFDIFPKNETIPKGSRKEDYLWPWDKGLHICESDHNRSYIDTNDTPPVTLERQFDYRDLRFCYDKKMGNIDINSSQNAELVEDLESHCWNFTVKENQNIRIFTTGFSNVELQLFGPRRCNNCFGQLRAYDDDSGEGFNASISNTLVPGTYSVIVRASNPHDINQKYTLNIKNKIGGVPLEIGKPFRADFSMMWEEDWYHFNVTESALYTMFTISDFDTVLTLYDSKETFIETDDNSGQGGNAKIGIPLEKGKYFLRVKSNLGDVGKYQVKIQKEKLTATKRALPSTPFSKTVITVVYGLGLSSHPDNKNPTPSTRIVLKPNNNDSEAKTSVADNTNNPRFKESFTFTTPSKVTLEVWDNSITKSPIGIIPVDLAKIGLIGQTVTSQFALQPPPNSNTQVSGTVKVKILKTN